MKAVDERHKSPLIIPALQTWRNLAALQTPVVWVSVIDVSLCSHQHYGFLKKTTEENRQWSWDAFFFLTSRVFFLFVIGSWSALRCVFEVGREGKKKRRQQYLSCALNIWRGLSSENAPATSDCNETNPDCVMVFIMVCCSTCWSSSLFFSVPVLFCTSFLSPSPNFWIFSPPSREETRPGALLRWKKTKNALSFFGLVSPLYPLFASSSVPPTLFSVCCVFYSVDLGEADRICLFLSCVGVYVCVSALGTSGIVLNVALCGAILAWNGDPMFHFLICGGI